MNILWVCCIVCWCAHSTCVWSLCRRLTVNTSAPSTTYHVHCWRKLRRNVRPENWHELIHTWYRTLQSRHRSLKSAAVGSVSVAELILLNSEVDCKINHLFLSFFRSLCRSSEEREMVVVEVERMLRLAEQCLERAKSFIQKSADPPDLSSCSTAQSEPHQTSDLPVATAADTGKYSHLQSEESGSD